jgi:hypothetical protein
MGEPGGFALHAIICVEKCPIHAGAAQLALLFPALLPSLQLFLFGPHTLYAGNPEEFSAPFSSIVVHLAPMILGVTGVLILIGLALPERFYRHYLVGLVGLGLVLWIQGNLIVAITVC